ncbi:MAG: PRC-barrel domain-containing protein [Bacteroidales bacterium]|nr:PRC-barrel domain-containing protein [Bacteroidales bacterium]
MLISVKSLKGYKLNSKDGEIGKVKEFYFDDKHWAVRYLVADTGNWLIGNRVLISPYALVSVNKEEEQIDINLSKKQVEESPSLNSDKPVSLQFEIAYYGYYGYPIYWNGASMWGSYPYIIRDREKWNKTDKQEKNWDPHLRSTDEVSGYHIQANDGEVGHIVDFIVDEETWAIRYLIIDTTNWFGGKKVLISPRWTDRISWNDSKVFVNLSLDEVKQSPLYLEEVLLTRDYETALHRHYNRLGYWTDLQV